MKRLFFLILMMLIIPIASAFPINIYYGQIDKDYFGESINVPVLGVFEEKGILGNMLIAIHRKGSGKIVFDSNIIVDSSTIESVIKAILYADPEAKNDFFISYKLNSESVSGQSTGASTAIAMLALRYKQEINPEYVITGSINKEGFLEETGGLEQKIDAVAGKIPNIIIPSGQAISYYYLKHGNSILAKEINLIETGSAKGVNVVEARHINEINQVVIKQNI